MILRDDNYRPTTTTTTAISNTTVNGNKENVSAKVHTNKSGLTSSSPIVSPSRSRGLKRQYDDKSPSHTQQQPSVTSTPVDAPPSSEKKARRKSMNKRVSFAPREEVRVFHKDNRTIESLTALPKHNDQPIRSSMSPRRSSRASMAPRLSSFHENEIIPESPTQLSTHDDTLNYNDLINSSSVASQVSKDLRNVSTVTLPKRTLNRTPIKQSISSQSNPVLNDETSHSDGDLSSPRRSSRKKNPPVINMGRGLLRTPPKTSNSQQSMMEFGHVVVAQSASHPTSTMYSPVSPLEDKDVNVSTPQHLVNCDNEDDTEWLSNFSHKPTDSLILSNNNNNEKNKNEKNNENRRLTRPMPQMSELLIQDESDTTGPISVISSPVIIRRLTQALPRLSALMRIDEMDSNILASSPMLSNADTAGSDSHIIKALRRFSEIIRHIPDHQSKYSNDGYNGNNGNETPSAFTKPLPRLSQVIRDDDNDEATKLLQFPSIQSQSFYARNDNHKQYNNFMMDNIHEMVNDHDVTREVPRLSMMLRQEEDTTMDVSFISKDRIRTDNNDANDDGTPDLSSPSTFLNRDSFDMLQPLPMFFHENFSAQKNNMDSLTGINITESMSPLMNSIEKDLESSGMTPRSKNKKQISTPLRSFKDQLNVIICTPSHIITPIIHKNNIDSNMDINNRSMDNNHENTEITMSNNSNISLVDAFFSNMDINLNYVKSINTSNVHRRRSSIQLEQMQLNVQNLTPLNYCINHDINDDTINVPSMMASNLTKNNSSSAVTDLVAMTCILRPEQKLYYWAGNQLMVNVQRMEATINDINDVLTQKSCELFNAMTTLDPYQKSVVTSRLRFVKADCLKIAKASIREWRCKLETEIGKRLSSHLHLLRVDVTQMMMAQSTLNEMITDTQNKLNNEKHSINQYELNIVRNNEMSEKFGLEAIIKSRQEYRDRLQAMQQSVSEARQTLLSSDRCGVQALCEAVDSAADTWHMLKNTCEWDVMEVSKNRCCLRLFDDCLITIDISEDKSNESLISWSSETDPFTKSTFELYMNPNQLLLQIKTYDDMIKVLDTISLRCGRVSEIVREIVCLESRGYGSRGVVAGRPCFIADVNGGMFCVQIPITSGYPFDRLDASTIAVVALGDTGRLHERHIRTIVNTEISRIGFGLLTRLVTALAVVDGGEQ